MTDRWWLRPLVATVLGMLPFVVFVGTSQTTVVNGETVLDSGLNLLGLVLAVLLTPVERAGVEDTVRGGTDQTPPCSAEADEEFMVYRAGIARDDRDRLVLQAELFRARFGG